MYRTGDPRFRRRLNELESTLERANEATQSGLYIFSQSYLKPCFESISSCVTTCIDASCPVRRDRIRRGRARAELNFDFYDDWDDEDDVGWGNGDEFDSLVGGGGGGYGTVTNTQPGRTRGMNYPDREAEDATGIPGSKSLFGRIFGGKAGSYKPTAAGLRENPGARRGREGTEAEALLGEMEDESNKGIKKKRHARSRSDTAGSGQTSDSYSSRGDIFPSDEEDDAIPLDDEFAMVLERRTTNSGFASAPETDDGSPSVKRGKRPSLGRRESSRRTVSSRSTRSSADKDKRRRSSAKSTESPAEEEVVLLSEAKVDSLPTNDFEVTQGATENVQTPAASTSTTRNASLVPLAVRDEEPSQFPTPTATDDEQDYGRQNSEADASKSNNT